MAVYRNADVHTRVWTHIQRPDGSTLELAPEETAELDLPGDFQDPYLQLGPRRVKRPKRTETTADTTTEQDGDGAAQTEDQGDAGSSDVAVETPQES